MARAIRNAIRANRFARIIRIWNPYFYSVSGRFARIARISDSRESGDSRESCESIRANHATKQATKIRKKIRPCTKFHVSQVKLSSEKVSRYTPCIAAIVTPIAVSLGLEKDYYCHQNHYQINSLGILPGNVPVKNYRINCWGVFIR